MFAFNVRKTLRSQNGDEKIERMAARGGWSPFCILHYFSYLFGQGDNYYFCHGRKSRGI